MDVEEFKGAASDTVDYSEPRHDCLATFWYGPQICLTQE